jgi:predicted ribosomally synthesized peptide with SipW-like signal peptide
VLDYMLMPFRRYADFKGRSRRMEFWSFTLFNVLVSIVIGIVVFGLGGSFAAFTDAENAGVSAVMGAFFGGFGLLFVVWWLATIIPSVAVTVRRLHDRDMSGWWYLGFILLSMIPLIGFIASIALFVVLVLPGTPGANRYGADPKDPTSAQVFA